MKNYLSIVSETVVGRIRGVMVSLTLSRKNFREPPKTLSGAVRQAVKDCKNLDRSVYLPHWHAFHEPIKNNVNYGFLVDELTDHIKDSHECMVCFAGGMIVGALAPPTEKSITPYRMPKEWKSVFLALDAVRSNRYWDAVYHFYGRRVTVQEDIRLCDVPLVEMQTFSNWREFDIMLDSLEVVAKGLEKEGW